LYQNIAAFTDVTKGTNAIGRGTGPIKYGFDATKGWDPATGMGSPNFSKLIAAIDALP
jgi:tripeptidyl-peptidase-1